MTNKRFSKATMIESLQRREERLRTKHRFDSGNGSAQVQGKGEEANLAYGQWVAIRDTIRHIVEGDL